jgi:hypothetical protein
MALTRVAHLTSEVKREPKPQRYGRRGNIYIDARPTGSGKTTEAIARMREKHLDEMDLKMAAMRAKEEGIDPEVYPPMTVNYYVAPNNNTKSRVFNEIKSDKDILKAKDSRIFLELKNSKAESALDKVYRRVKEGGKPIIAAVFGKNTMFYTLLVERELYQMGIPHRSQVFLDDYVTNLAMTLIPVSRTDRKTGQVETLVDTGAYEYYQSRASRFVVKREKYGITLEGLADDQYEYLKELVSSASRFLLEWEEPLYLTGEHLSSYVWDEERLKEILLHGNRAYVSTPEEVWATIRLLEWLAMGSKMALIITPNKPRASRALSVEREEHAEQLLRVISYMELLLMSRNTAWVKEVLERVAEGRTVRLSDVQANTLIAHALASAGMDIHIINGTAVLEGGGYFHHGGFGYVLTPKTDEHGRFEGWHAQKIISDNDKTLEVDPVGGRKDVTITLDGITGFPTLEDGVRRFMERTGLSVYSVRASLEDSMIAPIHAIQNIIIPKYRERFVNAVYQDLEEKRHRIASGEDPYTVLRDLKGFHKRIKGLSTMSLVRNLHIVARSYRMRDNYEILSEVMESQRRLQEEVRDRVGEGVELLNVYSLMLLAEIIRRYLIPDLIDNYRIVLDPKIIKAVSHVPVLFADVPEVQEDLKLVRELVPSRAIAQANRGRTDKVVRPKWDPEVNYEWHAFVLWLTSVDPLYEHSSDFKYFVGLSEVNQTLGRFVLRGPDTAQRIDAFVYLGGGTSDFTFKAITSLLHLTKEVRSEEEKVVVREGDDLEKLTEVFRLGMTVEDQIALYERMRREEWLKKAQPEQVLTPEQAAVVDQVIAEMEAKGEENLTVEDALRLLQTYERLDGQQRILSPEWYTDPEFDFKPQMISKQQWERAMTPRTEEEIKAEAERLKRLKRRREANYVRALKLALEENYNIGTSIDNPNELKKLLKALDDTGVVPKEYRNRVWDVAGEENPHILGTWE